MIKLVKINFSTAGEEQYYAIIVTGLQDKHLISLYSYTSIIIISEQQYTLLYVYVALIIFFSFLPSSIQLQHLFITLFM